MKAKLRAAARLNSSGTITVGGLFLSQDEDLRELMVTWPSGEHPLGSKVSDDLWIWPKSYMPGQLCMRSVRFTHISEFPVFSMAVKRYILAQMFFPLQTYKDIASLRKRSEYIGRIVQEIGRRIGDGRFSDIGPDVLRLAYETVLANAPSARRQVMNYLCEIHEFGRRNVIPDSFRFDSRVLLDLATRVPGSLPERPETHQNDAYHGYQPLPDAYIAAAGKVWMYYLVNIMPNLERVIRAIPAISDSLGGPRLRPRKNRSQEVGPSAMKRRSAAAFTELLEKTVWVDENGGAISSLPFEYKGQFPPKNLAQLMRLWGEAQSSLMHVLLLLTGGRQSEIRDLLRNCSDEIKGEVTYTLEYSKDERISWLIGNTTKTSALKRGTERDWPIPTRMLKPIELQRRMGRVVAPLETSLWVSTSNQFRFKGVLNCYHYVTRFAAAHGLEDLLQGTKAHPHRFRKSLARLVMLCLTEGLFILQDILGHADLMVTLKYIMADPVIRYEMAEISAEYEVEQGTRIADSLDGAGGKGAAHLRTLRDDFFRALKVPVNERQQRRRVGEFVAAKLLEGSSDIKMIFPGIICLKPKAALGACGSRDVILPSSCQCSCMHYMAMPSQRSVTRDNIEFLIVQLEKAENQKNILLAPWYRAQLAEQVSIFSDLRSEYAADERCNAALRVRA